MEEELDSLLIFTEVCRVNNSELIKKKNPCHETTLNEFYKYVLNWEKVKENALIVL